VTEAETSASFNVVLPTYFPVAEAKSVVVTLISADSSEVYDVEVPLTGLTASSKMGRMNFVDSDRSANAMLVKLTQDVLNDISLSLNISEIANPLQTGLPSNQTDVVRYVRVKV
jgi:hypothetical protein